MRIMICSNQPTLVKALGDRLRKAGHEVLPFVAAVHSVHSIVREQQPDVLVTDEWASEADHILDDVDFALVLVGTRVDRSALDGTRRTVVLIERSATLQEVVGLLNGLGSMHRGTAHRAPWRSATSVRDGDSRRLARFLSTREREVLSELVRGADTATLAQRLHISSSTARDHVQSIMTKMNAHSRLELVSIAVRDGLVDPATGLWLFDAS
jgi:two-component system nitrate/nitrite response regulator NarL